MALPDIACLWVCIMGCGCGFMGGMSVWVVAFCVYLGCVCVNLGRGSCVQGSAGQCWFVAVGKLMDSVVHVFW